ncbi:MAG: hypothetical protein EOM03_05950 [Clostridia bacterium]|nr:hypothetical protein [Clostridia bacterium]
MATDKPRFSITVSDDMYEQINEFQHLNKLATQTKAIASLLELGISSINNEISPPITINNGLLEGEHDLLNDYRKLCCEQQWELRGYLKRMLHEAEAAEASKQIKDA